MQQYDAIIVGGSFAGLSVARQVKGNVLLVTKYPLGTHQTSACCTYLPVLEQLGCEESILQTIRTVVVHLPNRAIAFQPRTPLCTFDYSIFCQSLARRLTAEVVVATAQACHHDVLLTTAGQFKARCLIDCSGWGAALVRQRQPNIVRHDRLSFGLETEVPSSDEAVHFYFDREIIDKGIAWVFPCGDYSRVGVGSYQGDTHIKSNLIRLLQKLRLPLGGLHGGYFPHALRPPVVDRLFLVGDSAGQCIPWTGEGIRSSIFFGLLCGGIVRQVIGGTRSLEQGLRLYAHAVRRHRRFYQVFFLAQRAFLRAPERVAAATIASLCRDPCLGYVQDRYEALSDLPLDGKDMKPSRRGFGVEWRGLSPGRPALPETERE